MDSWAWMDDELDYGEDELDLSPPSAGAPAETPEPASTSGTGSPAVSTSATTVDDPEEGTGTGQRPTTEEVPQDYNEGPESLLGPEARSQTAATSLTVSTWVTRQDGATGAKSRRALRDADRDGEDGVDALRLAARGEGVERLPRARTTVVEQWELAAAPVTEGEKRTERPGAKSSLPHSPQVVVQAPTAPKRPPIGPRGWTTDPSQVSRPTWAASLRRRWSTSDPGATSTRFHPYPNHRSFSSPNPNCIPLGPRRRDSPPPAGASSTAAERVDIKRPYCQTHSSFEAMTNHRPSETAAQPSPRPKGTGSTAWTPPRGLYSLGHRHVPVSFVDDDPPLSSSASRTPRQFPYAAAPPRAAASSTTFAPDPSSLNEAERALRVAAQVAQLRWIAQVQAFTLPKSR
ncbi:hypothetical protein JCM5296_002081 [Sporobolomyces johnsonii]